MDDIQTAVASALAEVIRGTVKDILTGAKGTVSTHVGRLHVDFETAFSRFLERNYAGPLS